MGMEYFYIICSLASLFCFIAYVADQLKGERRRRTYLLLSFFVITTLIFWLWFYYAPSNPVREKIAIRSSLVGSYQNSRGVDVYVDEGEFTATNNGGRHLFGEVFENPPQVSLVRANTSHGMSEEPPELTEIDKDYFEYRYNDSSQGGRWKFRARGKLLRKLNP